MAETMHYHVMGHAEALTHYRLTFFGCYALYIMLS
jgi:hypothetical protein